MGTIWPVVRYSWAGRVRLAQQDGPLVIFQTVIVGVSSEPIAPQC